MAARAPAVGERIFGIQADEAVLDGGEGKRHAEIVAAQGRAGYGGFSFQRAYSRDGTSSSAESHASALPSEGARQSPRGESEPPEPTFGPFGIALLLNWLVAKNRVRKTFSH